MVHERAILSDAEAADVSDVAEAAPAGRRWRRLGGAFHAGGQTVWAGFWDIIIPPTCLGCREPMSRHDTVCASCWRGIDFIRQPLCDRLGLPLSFDLAPAGGGVSLSAAAVAHPPAYDRARAVAHFSGGMRDMILQFKYGDTHHARVLFGRWLTSAGAELIADCDVIAPVPMHPRRLLARRFNQAAILAKQVAQTNDRRFVPELINRTRNTVSQVGLDGVERRRNLAGALAVTARQRRMIEGRKILLIDDVITTGTTLNACARVLRKAGALRVDALALAIVTPESTIRL